MAAPAHDAVLLIGFGGPTRPEQIRPFLDNVLRGKPVPPERREEVVHHYLDVGGASPYNELTFALAEALGRRLVQDGSPLPVYVGMRHWDPYLAATLGRMAQDGRRHAVGVVLAAHRSPPSWEAYLRAVDEARGTVGAAAPAVDYLDDWSAHPLFVEALAERTTAALESVSPAARDRAGLVFTAHSIPTPMSDRSGYAASIARTGGLVAARLGRRPFSVAYTSRSGNPADPWLEPDISDALERLRRENVREVVVSPIGFLCDHVEVLYDLDREARGTAERLGLGFHRAGTVGDHPAFVRMLSSLVVAARRPGA